MKKKAIIAIMMAAVMALSAVSVLALDYYVPEDAVHVTARFFLVEEADEQGDEFQMVSEDGEMVINITDDTLIYFEDYVPLCDECEDLTQMVREVLFDRTLAEVLDGRNMRVIFVEGDYIEPVSIMILFEIAVHLPQDIDEDIDLEDEDGDEDDYAGFLPLPEDIDWDDVEFEYDPIILIGEVVVNGVILENAPAPFLLETESGDIVMVPLRVVAEALDYDVSWNGYLRSVQLGVGIHLWIGGYEAHVGRMAPIELSTAPVLVNHTTFVSLEFFRSVLNQTAYVFEGQVVIETYSDMM